jgi:hypothetical protein
MQHSRRGVQRDGRPGLDPWLVPPLAFGVPDGDHVVREDPAEAGVGEQRVALGSAYRRRVRTDLEVEAVVRTHAALRFAP